MMAGYPKRIHLKGDYMIYANEIFKRTYETVKKRQIEWLQLEAEKKLVELINKNLDKTDILKEFKLIYPKESLREPLINLDDDGFDLSDGIITVKESYVYARFFPSIFDEILEKLRLTQEKWFDERVQSEILALIDKGCDVNEITEKFKVNFPVETLGIPLINFSQYGYVCSNDYVITIRDDLK